MQGIVRAAARQGIGSALVALSLTFALAFAFVQRADAAGPSLFAEGLHISTGAIVDPNDRVWVADHNAGFCRIKPSNVGPGVIDHPQHPGEDVDHTCLGGLLPEAATGPDAAGQPAFIDPSPEFKSSGDEFVLIPDGAAPSSDVVRADWNPDTGLFEFRDIITMNADTGEDRPRPVAVSAAPDGNAYVVFQRSGTIQRIVDPESPNPTVDLVATTSDGRGAAAVAAVYGPNPLSPPRVIVAETTGLREVQRTPATPGATRTTELSSFQLPSDPTPSVVSALTYQVIDATLGTFDLYAGTADSLPQGEGNPNADRVLRWGASGQPQVVARGLSTVGGFGVRDPLKDRGLPSGGRDLFVLDDPALVLAGEPLGTGRMFSVGNTWARITGGPDRPTRNAVSRFTIDGEGARECSVDGGTWQSCGATFDTPALGEGPHTFAVRAQGATISEIRRFKVDLTAAKNQPTIVSPAEKNYTSARPYFEFDPASDADEGTYECKITRTDLADGDVKEPIEGEFKPCDEGRPAEALAEGQYQMVIRARDAAGNPETFDGSEPVSEAVNFIVGTPAPGPDVAELPNGALASPDSVVQLAGGLHISTGSIQAPDGSLWVTDHNAGLCRVSKPSFNDAGTIEHPQLPGGAGPNTCLGGLLPEARVGADAAGQPVLLDPTPRNPSSGDEVAIVPDGSRPSTVLFRAQWNPGSKRFDPLDEIVTPLTADDKESRPTAVALGPDPDGPNKPGQPDLFVVRKSDNEIVRVRNAAGENPVVTVVGQGFDKKNFEAIAVGQRTVTIAATETEPAKDEKRPVIYIGEPAGGVTRLIPDSTATDARTTLRLPGFTGSVGALAYDKARDLLYIGTADAGGTTPTTPGTDSVWRFKVTENATGAPTLDNQGEVGEFSMVGGLSVRPSGQVLVNDDVALTLPDEPMGTGRLYQIGSPAAHVASGPTDEGAAALDPSFTSDPTPEFTVSGDGSLQCVVRLEGVTPTADQWQPCGHDVSAAGLMAQTRLADGTYVLSVRSTADATAETQDDTSLFVPESKTFTVDTVAPGTPAIAVPVRKVAEDDSRSNASPWFTFSPADDDKEHAADLEWRCRLNPANDDDPFTACHPGRTYPLNDNGSSKLRNGSNTIEVKAVDKAGNETGTAGQHGWLADTSIPKVTITAPGGTEQAVVRQGPRATFTYDVDDATAETGCRLDGRPWKKGCKADGETFNGLAEGAHVFKVHARDAYGNMSPTAIRRIIVDTTRPVVTIGGVPALSGPNVTATFAVTDASKGEGGEVTRFFCTLDGVVKDCLSGSLTMTGLTDGAHTLVVYGVDDVGNKGVEQTFTWNVTGNPPAQTPPATGGPGPGAGGGQGPGQGGAAGGGQGRGRGGLVAVQLAPTIQATALRAQGLPITVRPPAGATTVRIRVFRVGGVQGRAAAVTGKTAARRKLVATVFRATPNAKTYRFRLKERKLRGLKPGRYVVEIRAGKSRTNLGVPVTRTIVIRGR